MTLRRRLAALISAAVMVGALTTGCGQSMTPEEALAAATARAQEAFAQLPPGAALKEFAVHSPLPCDDLLRKKQFHEVEYSIEHPPSWPIEQAMQTLVDYWASHGYTVSRDDRQKPKTPQYFVRHSDGFGIGYQLTYREDGTIDGYLTSSSPCS